MCRWVCVNLSVPTWMYISHLLLCFEVSKVSEEFSLRRKLSWLQEMKQTEEFLHSVLERSAGQQHLVFLGEGTQIKHEYTMTEGGRKEK